jgi:hypothetical protein
MRIFQRIAIILFFFSINFEMWDPFYTNGHFSISKLAGLFYLFMMIPLILKFRTPVEYKRVLWPIILFFLLLTIVSAFNIRTGSTNFIDFTIFQNIVLFWILINHENSDNLILEKAMLGFAVGSIVLSLLFTLGIGIDFDPTSNRTTIFDENANNVGIRMSISLIILPLAIFQNRLNMGKIRYLFLLGIPLLFSTMIATGSRVSFIAFILAYVTFIFLYQSKSRWGKTLLFLVGILTFIFVWQFVLKSEGITERLIQSIQQGDLSERDIVWKKIWPIWLDNPVFGVGKTGYEYLTTNPSGRFISPHNVILEILCLTGITGLILYFVFLYRITKIGYQTFKYQNYLLSILLLIPVFGLLLSAQLLQVKTGWIIFSYIAAHSIYLRNYESN